MAVLYTTYTAAKRLAYLVANGLTPWPLTQFYIDYDAGLIRRGCLGTVLRVGFGGPPPIEAAYAAALTGTVAGLLGVAYLLAVVVSDAPRGGRRWLAAGLLVASPFGPSLLLVDIGRVDGFTFAGLAVVVAVLRGSASTGRVLLGLVAVCTVVVAVAEFAVLFLVPVVAFGLVRRGYSARHVAAVLALPVALAAFTLANRPDVPALRSMLAAAQHAGVLADGRSYNAVTALNQGAAEGLARLSAMSAISVAVMFVGAAVGFVVVVGLVTVLLAPHEVRDRLFLVGVGCSLVAAEVMCLVGVDFRRWWTFAVLAVVAMSACVAPRDPMAPRPRPRPVPVRVVAAVTVVVLVCLTVQGQPIYPEWDAGSMGTPLPGLE